MMETLIKQVKRGTFVLIPISDRTRGHGTHTLPAVWGDHVAAFLATVRN
jgi:homoserine O-acetyltransferase